MLDSTKQLLDWFRKEAINLPNEQKNEINFIISGDNARIIFLRLDEISKIYVLPGIWKDKIEEY